MKAELYTITCGKDLELTKLWLRGLEKFWPDHPKVRVFSDGSLNEAQLDDICHGHNAVFVSNGAVESVIRENVPEEIAPQAVSNYRVRRSYITATFPKIHEVDYHIWLDVDALLFNRPEWWLDAMTKHPDKVICQCHPSPSIGVAMCLGLALRIVPGEYDTTKFFPHCGLYSMPSHVLVDSLGDMNEWYLRILDPERGIPTVASPVIQQGLWQCLVHRYGKFHPMPLSTYQTDILKLQLRPSIVHLCSEKLATPFWEGFLGAYSRHLDDPQDYFAKAEWIPKKGKGHAA